MSRLLRSDLDEVDVYVTRIAEATGIPASHIEKDYWVTEVLRGAAAASRTTGCSLVFKGGTSLSKAHHLIQRFSEDVDLIAVLPAGGAKAKDSALKAFVEGASAAAGLTPETDQATTTKGVKRTSVFTYPTVHGSGVLRSGVLMELGTRGGALPQRRLAVQSLITEHAESIGLPVDFHEAEPVSILVLEPVRTLVDKLVLLITPPPKATKHAKRRPPATTTTWIDSFGTTTCSRSSVNRRSTCWPARCASTHAPPVCLPQPAVIHHHPIHRLHGPTVTPGAVGTTRAMPKAVLRARGGARA